MKDFFAREINYMRVSITDRCNLRCIYCMPHEGVPFIPHCEILRFEELLRLCKIMAKLGIKTIKVTGGEPLVRKGCVNFIRSLKNTPGIENVTLTTNGIYLGRHLEYLTHLGLDGLNISLDAIENETYRKITGVDAFEKVLAAIKQAAGAGLKVKINCVPIKGINDSQILPVASLAENLPVGVRFIELMPTGLATGLAKNLHGITTANILSVIKTRHPTLEPDKKQHGFGPAKYYKSDTMKGNIGFISAKSDNFCALCNRVRLNSVGFLTLCLHNDAGMDLKAMIRGGYSDDEIEKAVLQSIKQKPQKHFFQQKTKLKAMSKIGG